MARNYENWLESFIEYASFGEAPRHMYFWTGVSAIAGVLRRQCWIEQEHFKWFPNFYICLVAPPGIVSKSTTAGIGMKLLRNVPGVKFGPEVVTWQALASAFVNAAETFELDGLHHVQSPLTIESSEFGNLLNPADQDMVNTLISLWDGKDLNKQTKHSGNDDIVNPCINLIACTTPSWIAGNFPEYMIGGGLTSRMVFVYADKKQKYVAYPGLHAPADFAQTSQRLTDDLAEIALRCRGEYKMSAEAIQYGEVWYQRHYSSDHKHLDDDRFGGYLARKQTHIHKLAMVLSAAEGDSMVITAEHLQIADSMTTDLEADMAMVFAKIGKTAESSYADQLIRFVGKNGPLKFELAYQYVYSKFPSMRNFEDVLLGTIRSGYLRMFSGPDGGQWLVAVPRKDGEGADDSGGGAHSPHAAVETPLP